MNAMCEFQNPEIIRNGMDIAYKFNIIHSDISSTIQLHYGNNGNIDKSNILHELTSNKSLPSFYNNFLIFSNKFFTKKYTPDTFRKYVTNEVTVPQLSPNLHSPVCAIFKPDNFYFTQKGIILNWSHTIVESKLDDFEFPELVETTKDTAKLHVNLSVNDLEEVNEIEQMSGAPLIDLVDEDEDSENIVSDMSRNLERSKVREARLKARLARLKAERTTEKYLSKYGATYSDLEDSETETDVDDDDDDDETEN